MKNQKHGSNDETTSERILRWFNKPLVILIVWTLLFLMTILYSELDARSLVTAFVAWVGGLITAHMDYVFRKERVYKDVSEKIAKNREYNKNVY